MIEKGANDWNIGLMGACYGGHLEIANLMIEKGVNCWNSVLHIAWQYGHLDIVNLIIEKGADPSRTYEMFFKIPKDDRVIEIIYSSLYDYLPDEMINIVLKYSIIEDFNLYEWLNLSVYQEHQHPTLKYIL